MEAQEIARRLVNDALADQIYRRPCSSRWEQVQLAQRTHGNVSFYVRQAERRAVWNAWIDLGRQR